MTLQKRERKIKNAESFARCFAHKTQFICNQNEIFFFHLSPPKNM